jgi:hypothetical protein
VKVTNTGISEPLRRNVKLFREGVRDFNTQELSDIKLYLLQYKDCLETTQFFEGKVKDLQIVSCFAESFHEELLEYMITKKKAAIAICVILSEHRVIFKKTVDCSINLCSLAKILCDGDCDTSSNCIAYGKLNETFLNFSKKLTPC